VRRNGSGCCPRRRPEHRGLARSSSLQLSRQRRPSRRRRIDARKLLLTLELSALDGSGCFLSAWPLLVVCRAALDGTCASKFCSSLRAPGCARAQA
jgi:hypothetical protein